MASEHLKKGLKRSALSLALGFCFIGGVQAQTNTAGAVSGSAQAGDTITIANANTGFSRTITVGADGAYRFSQVPIGQYTVTRNGTSPRTVTVNVGTAANVSYAAPTGNPQELEAVTVTGQAVNPIDVTSVESTTILTAEQLAKIPVARDTTSVALLAPGTVKGDGAFGNLASFGGSSVAENQYYINGFNVTNSFRSLNFSKVPFEAIQEQQVKTGGYGAEFGRSLGGVINQITKRGTNDFHAGGNIYWAPDSLREDVKNVYYANPLVATDFGLIQEDNSKDEFEGVNANLWASGALIKDRLFAYGLVSLTKNDSTNYGNIDAFTNNDSTVKTPGWLVKLDWNINDNNLLEFTAFSDDQTTKTSVYSNQPRTLNRGNFAGKLVDEQGGDNYVLKYTGYMTDTFTLSALYGHGVFKRQQHLENPDGSEVVYSGNITDAYATDPLATTTLGGCPAILDIRPGYRKAVTGTYGSSCHLMGGALLQADNNEDTRDQWRIDAEWALGSHQIRFGIDVDDYESVAGEANVGGWLWRYSTRNPDGVPNNGDEFDVVRRQTTARGTTVKLEQQAFYIEDSWNITDNFIVYYGGRWDTFKNKSASGDTFVEIKNQFGPRLGFSWDVNGDSTFKIYGNAGRYALPLTPSVAVRGSSASIFQRSNNNLFTGVDPVTGVPVLAGPLNPLNLINGEDGRAHDSQTIASKNLDPMYQDEYILGMQMQVTDHMTFGTRAIMRELKAAIDDNCDYTAVLDANPDTAGQAVIPNPSFPYCRLINPGKDAVLYTDLDGDGPLAPVLNTIPGARLAPEAKRSYSALEFFLDGNWDKFFFQGSYTLAYNKGNTEGGVKSDIGQSDTNTTQDFDYRELAVDTYGYLPNDRRHALKLFGNYEITDEWSVGLNLLVQSGRPINCLGVLQPWPSSTGFHPYGSSFMRCGTTPAGQQPVDFNDLQGPHYPFAPRPRGTAGRLPWTNSIDLNVGYAPSWAPGLMFKVDVFNVMNSQKVTSVSEVAEDADTGIPLNTYLLPRSYQAPRSVRFMVQYDF
jgi:hypothetical protein